MSGISSRETCFSSLASIGKVCISHVTVVLISHPVWKRYLKKIHKKREKKISICWLFCKHPKWVSLTQKDLLLSKLVSAKLSCNYIWRIIVPLISFIIYFIFFGGLKFHIILLNCIPVFQTVVIDWELLWAEASSNCFQKAIIVSNHL